MQNGEQFDWLDDFSPSADFVCLSLRARLLLLFFFVVAALPSPFFRNASSGPLIQRELKEGETLRVSSGSVVAFAPSVQYDVQTIPGFKNVVFGGEGLFITKLTG